MERGKGKAIGEDYTCRSLIMGKEYGIKLWEHWGDRVMGLNTIIRRDKFDIK